MSKELVFSKIQKENIFCCDFQDFKRNNSILFSPSGIAVLYAPNGTGKTSLSKVLSSSNNSFFTFTYNGEKYDEKNSTLFHIINDQNGRNIISGETNDFFLGDNIKQEFELKKFINKELANIITKLIYELDKTFNIKTKSSHLVKYLENQDLKRYIQDIANSKSKGKEIKKNIEDFLEKVFFLEYSRKKYDEKKLAYLIKNCSDNNSTISKLVKINSSQIQKESSIQQIEENTAAIEVLKKFNYKEECIVCDNSIDYKKLFHNKTENKEKLYNSLDSKTKEILEQIVGKLPIDDDPFNIESILLSTIKTGEKDLLNDLQKDLQYYFNIFNEEINNLFAKCCTSDIRDKFLKYKDISKAVPFMDGEDIKLIQRIADEHIDKKITLKRDENSNLKLLIGNKELINCGREELPLSSGEQNFISLAFEILKAKKTENKIIILDDPISSFDSIYKNKIAYIIIKLLENKNKIILTHNLDLVKLIEHQKKKSFNFYILNNTDGEDNGFIKVNDEEKKMVLDISELLGLFRDNEKILSIIEDKKNFLIAMIPFLRGYSQIISSKEKNDLTKLMHGFNSDKVDLNDIYKTLFQIDFNINLKISVEDIINMDINNIRIFKPPNYPLLDKTLCHTLTYLYLRLKVEKILVEKYNINIKKYDQLGRIIKVAFEKKVDYRVFLNSKKTLLNEFNHFEGNMNIFQPAIDITDTVLNKEKISILDFLEKLQNED